jgi:PAS domain S-box-containing protein
MRSPDGEEEYAMIKGEPILILLVDDDPAHSEAVRRALKASGMNVVIQPAGTLKAYRELAAAHQPDIAILDLSLPDGRAVEVLISPPEAGPFPIVVITSQGDELLAVEAMKAGALDYIVKSPEAFAGMPRTVERVLHEWGMLQERKRAEEALRESEEKYRTLFDNAGEAIFVVQDGKLVFSNPMSTRMVGYPSEELRNRPFTEFIHPDDRNMVVERHLKRLRGEELPAVYSFRILNRDGNTLWMDLRAVLINWEGQAATLNFVSDITERKQAEEAVQASLREKETLLREIHHRVKNNMQVISSLFNLQAGYIKDEEALRILKEGQTRIRSMALVHEKLYQSGDLSKIDLAGYIQSLSAHLFHVYLVDPNQVRLETEFGDVTLDINSAVPCGLILNELISNALKHAFPAGRKGVLTIRLRRRKDGAVELRIADNGVGFPKGLDFRRTESLGLQIVNLLVGQLEGTIKLAGKNGTVFTVAFREMKQELGIGADRGHK